MPRPSKFTAEAREKILQALRIGASRRTAAAIAGLEESTLRTWIRRGKENQEGGRFREFFEAVMEAEASPRMRALGVLYKEMPDNPALAWKYIERREPGYEAPLPTPVTGLPQPVNITLSFFEAPTEASTQFIEAEVVNGEPGTAPARKQLEAGPSSEPT